MIQGYGFETRDQGSENRDRDQRIKRQTPTDLKEIVHIESISPRSREKPPICTVGKARQCTSSSLNWGYADAIGIIPFITGGIPCISQLFRFPMEKTPRHARLSLLSSLGLGNGSPRDERLSHVGRFTRADSVARRARPPYAHSSLYPPTTRQFARRNPSSRGARDPRSLKRRGSLHARLSPRSLPHPRSAIYDRAAGGATGSDDRPRPSS